MTNVPELYAQYLELEAEIEKRQQEKVDYFGHLTEKYQMAFSSLDDVPKEHRKTSQTVLDEYWALVARKEKLAEEIYGLLNNTIYPLENGKLLVGYIDGDKPTIEERELYEQKLNHGKTL